MKKNVIKTSVRNIIDGILIFFLFITTTVYALPSNGVLYDNSNSGSTAGTVNEALDDLYTKVNDKQNEINQLKSIGDAAAGHILSGKTAYVKGQTITGTIPSKGATTYTPSTKDQTIASGNYLSGVQTIKGDANLVAANIAKGKTIFGVAGSYTSDANAAAGNILSGKTAYVNGSKITGTMKDNGAMNKTITGGGSVSIPAGYTSGGTVTTTHVIKSWTPNYGQWTSTNEMYTTDEYSVNATSLYVLVRAENGGTVAQYSTPSCTNGTVSLLVNNGAGVLYYISKTADAKFTLGVTIKRVYSSYPNSTLKIYAFTAN